MTPSTHSSRQTSLDAMKLQVLSEICQLIGTAVHLDTTLGKILRILHETLQMERATLVLLDSSGKQLAIRASCGLTVKEELRGVYNLDEGICGQIFQTCSPFVVPITLPPLRKKKEDIPLLLDHFLRSSNKRNERDIKLTKQFLDFLVDYNWPGNVRELQNLVERLVILNDDGLLRIEDLPDTILNMPQQAVPAEAPFPEPDLLPTCGKNSKMSLKDIEQSEIEAALKRHGWVQARAAGELGLTQRQIGYKIKKMGLKKPGTF